MKKFKNRKISKVILATLASAMLVACGETTDPVIEDPVPSPEPIVEPDVVNEPVVTEDPVEDPEIPDVQMESQMTCSKFDESISITEDEVYDFFGNYIFAFKSGLCSGYFDNGLDDVVANPDCIENIGCVYGISEAISELGEGSWSYYFDTAELGTIDDVCMTMIENDIMAPQEMGYITDNVIYTNGTFCVNAYEAQKILDAFYGEGVVDTLSFDNYEEAFSTLSGYIVTGTGIGGSSEYIYDPKNVEINGNVATVLCDKYTSMDLDEYEVIGESEITLYKDATGVHFYSKKDLMAE